MNMFFAVIKALGIVVFLLSIIAEVSCPVDCSSNRAYWGTYLVTTAIICGLISVLSVL